MTMRVAFFVSSTYMFYINRAEELFNAFLVGFNKNNYTRKITGIK